MNTNVMITNAMLSICHQRAAVDSVRWSPLLHRTMLVLGLGFMLAATARAAVVAGAAPRDWPANPAKHVIKIRRDADDAVKKKMIAIAEATSPDQKALSEALVEIPLSKDGDQWWHQEQLGIRIPFAITGAAVDYYSRLVDNWRKQAFKRYSEPCSSLDYHATAEFHENYEHEGRKFSKVHVVNLKLAFSENFAATTTEGMSFQKQRTVILDSDGKVLVVSGDGPTEVPVLAI